MRLSWRDFWDLPLTGSGAAGWRRSALVTVVLYGALVLGFSLLAIGVEVALGHPLQAATPPGISHSLVDAIWHLGTALVLAIPARRWVAVWLAPVLALGLDVDHVFGDVLPTVTGRTAHDLLFVLLVAGLLYWLQGRSASLFAAGAVLAHIGVDGGGFPLFGPATPSFFSPPLAILITFIGAASALCFVAARPAKEVGTPLGIGGIALASGCVATLFAYLPVLSSFIGQ